MMNYTILLASVFAVHILATISPGPNFLIVTQKAIRHSRRAGIATALGVATGSAVWAGLAILGLHVVFTNFTFLFSGLKVLGGVYLLYLGFELWRQPVVQKQPNSDVSCCFLSDWRAFQLGLLTNMTNPKSIIFFGSIFAAFLTPTLPVWVKVACVVIVFMDAAAWYVAVACLFSLRQSVQAYQRMNGIIDRVIGSVLGLLGLRLIFSDH